MQSIYKTMLVVFAFFCGALAYADCDGCESGGSTPCPPDDNGEYMSSELGE